MTTKDKLKDSLYALAKEYRISERWVEHFEGLFDEIEEKKVYYKSFMPKDVKRGKGDSLK